ncbi:MAG: O-antigen/teichoic acid export membrane protein, partial [Gammaproteobacteria bacterium]
GFSLDPQMSVIVYILTIVVTLTVAILLLNKFWPRNAYHVKPLFRNRSWTKSLIPFTLISGISVIYQKTDILMLGAMTTAEDVGVYNVAVQGAVLVSFAIYIFTNVLSPNIVSLHAQGEHHRLQRLFNLSTIGMSALAGIVFFGFIGLGEWLLETVFGAAYVSAYLPLCILSGAHFFSAIIGPAGSYLSMTGHEKRTLNALAYTAILNVVLNAFFISKFGIMGAASATALSVIFCNLFLGLQVYRYLDIIPGPIRPKTNEVDRSNT